MVYRICRIIARALLRALYRMEPRGASNVPAEGPVVLCSNHKNLQDPVSLAAWLNRKVYYMAKEELFRVPVLRGIIRYFGAFPVKRGGVTKETLRTALDILRGGNILGVFPEGTRNRTLGEGKRGAVTIALRAGAAVVPVALIGDYRPFSKMIVVYGEPLDLAPYGGDAELATQAIMDRIREMLETGRPSSGRPQALVKEA